MEEDMMKETVSEVKSPAEDKLEFVEAGPISFNWMWYLGGIIFLLFALVYLFKANAYLDTQAKIFIECPSGMGERYVGGDAYNYIIAGTYSTTLTVRALLFAVLGGVSLLMGKNDFL